MRVVIDYDDVHEKNLGYDLSSLDLNSGELRLIEVKGKGSLLEPSFLHQTRKGVLKIAGIVTGFMLSLTARQKRNSKTRLKTLDASNGHEVKKVDHYWLKIDTLTEAM